MDKYPAAARPLAEKGHGAGIPHDHLAATRTEAVIPSTRSRKAPISFGAQTYRGRNLIERASRRLKD